MGTGRALRGEVGEVRDREESEVRSEDPSGLNAMDKRKGKEKEAGGEETLQEE